MTSTPSGPDDTPRSERFTPDTKLVGLYVEWIEQFHVHHARAWAHLFNNDPEAAMCEATYWGVLHDCGVSVQPYEGSLHDRPSPDFLCEKGGERFYVEVTCLHIDRVSEATSLSHFASPGAQNYANLNRAIFQEVIGKTRQCAALDAPALVAVGTFHYQASALCFQKKHIEMLLTGDSMISWLINTQTGKSVGDLFLSTKLRSATFLKPGGRHGPQAARLPVSGLLLGGFGCDPVHVYGLLHPDPKRPFDRRLLDRIEFCELLRDDAQAALSVKWF